MVGSSANKDKNNSSLESYHGRVVFRFFYVAFTVLWTYPVQN